MSPSLGLLLTTFLLAAPPAKEDPSARRAEATLQRAVKLPQDEQRIWLRLIEQRYAWAVRLTMKPDDAKREEARVAEILRRKSVAWNDLLDVLRELERREKSAISRLVRRYRSEVYETFHKQPREMLEREDAWYRIWSLWEKAGSPPEQQDRLMDWLAAAVKLSTKDTVGQLPPDPKFGADVPLVSEQLVKELSKPPAADKRPAEDVFPPAGLQAREPLPLRVPDSQRCSIR